MRIRPFVIFLSLIIVLTLSVLLIANRQYNVVFGFLFSLVIFFVFREAQEPERLRKLVEEKTRKLADSEKYFRTIAENGSDAITLLDKTGKVIYQTPSAEQITGYSLTEINQLENFSLVHPQDREEQLKDFQQFAASPSSTLQRKYRVKHKNGNYIRIAGTFRNLLSDENVKAIVYTYSDITEKTLLENKLTERVKELSTIYKISRLLQNEFVSTESVLTEIANILPAGWQFPDICAAAISFNGKNYQSNKYCESNFKQQARFVLTDGRTGVLEVVYFNETPFEFEGAFLKEEQELIDSIAEAITTYFNKEIQQRKLIGSEAKFRAAFEDSAIGMAILAPGGEFMEVNGALCDMLGFKESEFLNRSVQKIIHPEDLEKHVSLIKQALAGKFKNFRIEERYIPATDEVLWVNLNVSLVTGQGSFPTYFVYQLENITEQKAAFTELAKSEANMRSIFNTAEASIILTDTNLDIVAVTRYMQDEYFRVNGKRMSPGTNLKSSLVQSRGEDVAAICKSVIANNKSEQYEASYFTPEGPRHFAVNVTPVTDQGKVTGICLFSFEVTARILLALSLEEQNIKLNELNEELQRNARQLQVSNTALQQFAYVASHDLQEPLRMVTGFLTQIERKYTDVLDEKGKQYINFAVDGAKRMRRLILELLEYSRAGEQEAKPEPIDTMALIDEIILLHSRQVEESGAEISYKDLPIVSMQRAPLRQIFQNLISNSLKYHREDTTPVIEISCRAKESFYEFTVADNGIGIEPQYFEKIFIIFNRLHGKDEYAGTGMGLAITKKIIDNLGGNISVESDNEGSRFTFTIPKNMSDATN